MSTFNEADHPRERDGKFAHKLGTSSGLSLAGPPEPDIPHYHQWTRDTAEAHMGPDDRAEYWDDGSLMWVERYENGRLGSSTGPGIMAFHEDGRLHRAVYLRDGKLHRDDGPAVWEQHADGSREIHYMRDGKSHREDGPAITRYYPDGALRQEMFFQNGDLNSARYVTYDRAGNIIEDSNDREALA